MAKNRRGQIRIETLDAQGKLVGDEAAIRLTNEALNHKKSLKLKQGSGRWEVAELEGSPRNLYKLTLRVKGYRPVGRFIKAQSGDAITTERLTLAIDPERVSTVAFPLYRTLPAPAKAMLGRSEPAEELVGLKGQALYEALANEPRAGLLNIFAKCDQTKLRDGKTVLEWLGLKAGALVMVKRDRVLAKVPRELFVATAESADGNAVHLVNGSLHKAPAGYRRAESFKTPDPFGNLQLTFFQSTGNPDEWLADIDIDDAAGLGHVFQVLRNSLRGQSTHPYDIHQILLACQKIDPGYQLSV